MTPVVDGFRLIMTENASLFAVSGQVLAVFGVTIVVYFISTRVFRWEYINCKHIAFLEPDCFAVRFKGFLAISLLSAL